MVKALQAGLGSEPVSVERRFQMLVDSVRDYAIYMLDPQGIVSSWNTGAERFKGYTATDIIGHHFSCFYSAEDQKAGVPQRALATAAAEGKFEAEGWRIRKDGTRFWASVVIDAIRDDTGILIGYTKVTRDITERRRAQEELEEARLALFQARKMEAVGQLTGGVAHDFNNLLQAIGGSLEMIEKRLAAGRTDVQPYAAAARTAVDRAMTLTQRLLAFARRQPLRPERADLNTLVMGMWELLGQSVGDAVRVERTLAEPLWPIRVDVNQIESALLNLAINARDAMPEGGRLGIETANVHLDKAHVASEPGLEPGDYVMLMVTDTGTGMPPDILDRAFEPFFTTKPVGQGTGLGLSQLYGFARQSGGLVRISSEAGRGTGVTLWLPRDRSAEPTTALPEEPPEPPSLDKGVGRIVVVEDEALVRMLLVETLEEDGFTVLEFAEGDSALAWIASSERIDLLVTDVGLPGINGRQLAEMARSVQPDLKVLFLTGYAFNAAMDQDALGADTQLLGKPVSMEAFRAMVRGLVQRR